MNKRERLEYEVIGRSKAETAEEAFKEWNLSYVSRGEADCLCGQRNIKNLCVLNNPITQIQIVVGSSCVEKFFGFQTEALFKDLLKLKENVENDHTVKLFTAEFAHKSKVINDWEFSFYKDLLSWKKVSEKQKQVRLKINKKILKLLDTEL